MFRRYGRTDLQTVQASGKIARAQALGSAWFERLGTRLALVLLAVWFPGVAHGLNLDDARSLMAQGQWDDVILQLTLETEQNPAHEAARILLAQACEKADRLDEALAAWNDLIALSNYEERLHQARVAISRIRRRQLDQADVSDTPHAEDPFKIPMPDIQWEGLEVIEDTQYLPAILPPPLDFEVPPFVEETEHFTVYTTNERLSKVIGERAEIYLEFMVDKLFGGRSWAVRFPILVYSSLDDYQRHGGLAGSVGATMGHVTGQTQAILLFQLTPQFDRGASRRPGTSGGGIWKYGIESVLPHELTHAVINEFFGGQETPRWLHEAVAGRFEQTRDHYGEAARLARKVVAGEYFRIQDLFEQETYPKRVGLFYEQAAAVVLYLFEAGPEAMHVFLSELRAGNGHDAACAAALGIPKENAVEEFERRWVEWMRMRYVKDLDNEGDDTIISKAQASTHKIFLPWVNEIDTVDQIDDWRDIGLDSLDAFNTVGNSNGEWSADGNILRYTTSGRGEPNWLGIRMNETAPVALTCDVKFLGAPDDERRLFGFVQLDADRSDTRTRVLASLRDNSTHKIVCVWSDDLSLYVDGVCTGRYPATQISGDARDIDYPLGFIAYGSVEIQNLRIARIKAFSDKPVLAQADDSNSQPAGTRPGSRRRRRSP